MNVKQEVPLFVVVVSFCCWWGFNQNTLLYFWRRHTRQLPIKDHWILRGCSRGEVLTAN